MRPYPWDSPGKNTGVGCHFLLQCMKVKSESEVAQSCPTLLDPMDCSLPGSSIHGILQARVLEWGAIAFSVYTYYPPHNQSQYSLDLSGSCPEGNRDEPQESGLLCVFVASQFLLTRLGVHRTHAPLGGCTAHSDPGAHVPVQTVSLATVTFNHLQL